MVGELQHKLWCCGTKGQLEGSGALLRGWKRATGQQQGGQGEPGHINREADRQGAHKTGPGVGERLPDCYLRELSDHVRHYIQGSAQTAAGHAD